MLEIKSACKDFFNEAITKFKELNDQHEIGKCIRTFILTVGIGYSVNTIIKNGGINYNNKLFIGTSQCK